MVVADSGLGAAEVGVGVDAALEIGFVGDIEPAEIEPARACAAPAPGAPTPAAGPIFRGASPTGGALVDMTAAISFAVCLFLFLAVLLYPVASAPRSAFCMCSLLFLVGVAGLSDRSSTVEWNVM